MRLKSAQQLLQQLLSSLAALLVTYKLATCNLSVTDNTASRQSNLSHTVKKTARLRLASTGTIPSVLQPAHG